MEKKVLIVEDDPDIAELLMINLNDIGFPADNVRDGMTGVTRALSGDYSLVILDVMLPKLDGLEVCKTDPSGNQNIANPDVNIQGGRV